MSNWPLHVSLFVKSANASFTICQIGERRGSGCFCFLLTHSLTEGNSEQDFRKAFSFLKSFCVSVTVSHVVICLQLLLRQLICRLIDCCMGASRVWRNNIASPKLTKYLFCRSRLRRFNAESHGRFSGDHMHFVSSYEATNCIYQIEPEMGI